MPETTFTIVFSNYTAGLFAWRGTPAANKKYLGNRNAIGHLNAKDEDDALAKWRARAQAR